jgi:hypothetical protein
MLSEYLANQALAASLSKAAATRPKVLGNSSRELRRPPPKSLSADQAKEPTGQKLISLTRPAQKPIQPKRVDPFDLPLVGLPFRQT